MITEMAGRLSSPQFIGRRAELDRLAAAFATASESHPSLVLIAGEAGVGKSRLVAEATRVANIIGKLCVANRVEAEAVAARLGLSAPEADGG
jgi:predicted ATP-dependent serine protease